MLVAEQLGLLPQLPSYKMITAPDNCWVVTLLGPSSALLDFFDTDLPLHEAMDSYLTLKRHSFGALFCATLCACGEPTRHIEVAGDTQVLSSPGTPDAAAAVSTPVSAQSIASAPSAIVTSDAPTNSGEPPDAGVGPTDTQPENDASSVAASTEPPAPVPSPTQTGSDIIEPCVLGASTLPCKLQ
jgi:hypothetical protein